MEYVQDVFWYKSDYLNHDFLREESFHYSFHFQKDSLAQNDIKDIVKLKEKYYIKILNWLNLDVTLKKIDYYLYSSLKDKISLIGDDSPGNAIWEKLNTNKNEISSKKFEIHVVYNERCKFINEHEDTHLLSLPWGYPYICFMKG